MGRVLMSGATSPVAASGKETGSNNKPFDLLLGGFDTIPLRRLPRQLAAFPASGKQNLLGSFDISSIVPKWACQSPADFAFPDASAPRAALALRGVGNALERFLLLTGLQL